MLRFVNTPDQDDLARAARGFVGRRLPVARLRAVRDGDRARVDRAAWREMAQLGWAGILVDEAHGGAGLGMVEIGLVMEELGRTLAATPMLATSVMGATAVTHADVLAAVCAGDRLLAFAFEERAHLARDVCETRARRDGETITLDGDKVNVLDGGAADQLVVRARDDRGETLLVLIDRDTPGLTVTPLARVDSRGAGDVRLRGVVVGADRAMADVTDRILARATAALTAEMLGGTEAVFATTIEYLKQRRQFGVVIGSFQALKHRAAHMFCEIELTRSVVRAALAALDGGAADAELLVSAAKARASDTFVHVAAEAVQMHGGIGVTDELDVGLYYKRARVAELTFGSAAHHRDRFARLSGY